MEGSIAALAWMRSSRANLASASAARNCGSSLRARSSASRNVMVRGAPVGEPRLDSERLVDPAARLGSEAGADGLSLLICAPASVLCPVTLNGHKKDIRNVRATMLLAVSGP